MDYRRDVDANLDGHEWPGSTLPGWTSCARWTPMSINVTAPMVCRSSRWRLARARSEAAADDRRVAGGVIAGAASGASTRAAPELVRPVLQMPAWSAATMIELVVSARDHGPWWCRTRQGHMVLRAAGPSHPSTRSPWPAAWRGGCALVGAISTCTGPPTRSSPRRAVPGTTRARFTGVLAIGFRPVLARVHPRLRARLRPGLSSWRWPGWAMLRVPQVHRSPRPSAAASLALVSPVSPWPTSACSTSARPSGGRGFAAPALLERRDFAAQAAASAPTLAAATTAESPALVALDAFGRQADRRLPQSPGPAARTPVPSKGGDRRGVRARSDDRRRARQRWTRRSARAAARPPPLRFPGVRARAPWDTAAVATGAATGRPGGMTPRRRVTRVSMALRIVRSPGGS